MAKKHSSKSSSSSHSAHHHLPKTPVSHVTTDSAVEVVAVAAAPVPVDELLPSESPLSMDSLASDVSSSATPTLANGHASYDQVLSVDTQAPINSHTGDRDQVSAAAGVVVEDPAVVAPAADQPLTPPLTPTMKPASAPAGSPPGAALISLIANTLPSPLRAEAEKLTMAVVAKRDEVLETAGSVVGTVSAVRDEAFNRVVAVRDQAVNRVVAVRDEAVNRVVSVKDTAVTKVTSVRDEAVNTVVFVRDEAVNRVASVRDEAVNRVSLVRDEAVNRVVSAKDSAVTKVSGARDSVLATLWSFPVVTAVADRASVALTTATQAKDDAQAYVQTQREYVSQVACESVIQPVTAKVHEVKSTLVSTKDAAVSQAVLLADQAKSTAVAYATPVVDRAYAVVDHTKQTAVAYSTPVVQRAHDVVALTKDTAVAYSAPYVHKAQEVVVQVKSTANEYSAPYVQRATELATSYYALAKPHVDSFTSQAELAKQRVVDTVSVAKAAVLARSEQVRLLAVTKYESARSVAVAQWTEVTAFATKQSQAAREVATKGAEDASNHVRRVLATVQSHPTVAAWVARVQSLAARFVAPAIKPKTE